MLCKLTCEIYGFTYGQVPYTVWQSGRVAVNFSSFFTMLKFSVSCFLVGIVLLSCSEGSSYDPTEHIYPWPLPKDRQPLFFSLITSFSENFDSSGVVPGVNVALDIINSNDSNLLNGYSLHYILSDSEVGGYLIKNCIMNCNVMIEFFLP